MPIDYKKIAEANAATSRHPFLEANVNFTLRLLEQDVAQRKDIIVHTFEVVSAKALAPGVQVPEPGAKRVVMFDFSKEGGEGRFVSYVEAFSGSKLKQTEADLKQRLADMTGGTVQCQTAETLTKKGVKITVTNWAHDPDPTPF